MPLPQILKLIGYLIRNIFMEKVCRKPAVKTSSMRLFNLVNCPKQPMHVWDFWKFHEKGNLIFSFAPRDFLWGKCWKVKMPGTSYQSLELEDMLQKREWKKTTKDWINREKSCFSKFLKCFFLIKFGKQKTKALNSNTQVHINVDLV